MKEKKSQPSKSKFDLVHLSTLPEAFLDGYGCGELSLAIERPKFGGMMPDSFMVLFKCDCKTEWVCIRTFPTILRALRSFRRFVLLSDEVKMGF